MMMIFPLKVGKLCNVYISFVLLFIMIVLCKFFCNFFYITCKIATLHCNYFFQNQDIKTFWTASLSCSRLLCRSRRCLCPAMHFHSKFILSIYHILDGLFQMVRQSEKNSERLLKNLPARKLKSRWERERAMFVYNSIQATIREWILQKESKY